MNKPVAWLSEKGKGIWFHEPDPSLNAIPLYTHPHKQLSDEEILDIATLMEINYGCVPPLEFAWAIIKEITE